MNDRMLLRGIGEATILPEGERKGILGVYETFILLSAVIVSQD
jgi:hypothetical protein